MASKELQRFLINKMMEASKRRNEQARAQEIAGLSRQLVGQRQQPAQQQITSPYKQSSQEMFPGEQPVKGLMNIDQQSKPAQKATGLYDLSDPKRNIAFNERMAASGMPSLQKRAFDNLSKIGGGGKEPDFLMARTFDVGAPEKMVDGVNINKGKVQRARNTVDGDLKYLGNPRYPRNPYASTGTALVNQNNPSEFIPIENRQKALDTALGKGEGESKEKMYQKGNDILLSDYKDESEQSNKYKATIDTTNRILDLSKRVETGKLVGSAPAVYLREMFGDTELQELNALIKGLPLPLLKATFGAAFSVKEGETLAESLANVRMDAPAFEAAMNRVKARVIYDERRFRKKQDWFQKNSGDLMKYRDAVTYPKILSSFDKENKAKKDVSVKSLTDSDLDNMSLEELEALR